MATRKGAYIVRAITCEVQITGCSTRNDGSLGIRIATPELAIEEKAAFMELQGHNLKMLLQPMTGEPAELKDVKTEMETKTPSMRMRGCLYRLWEHMQKPGEWEDFYRRRMEAFINGIKHELPQP